MRRWCLGSSKAGAGRLGRGLDMEFDDQAKSTPIGSGCHDDERSGSLNRRVRVSRREEVACEEWRDKKKRLNAEHTENAEGTERKRGRRDKREKRRAGLKPGAYKKRKKRRGARCIVPLGN